MDMKAMGSHILQMAVWREHQVSKALSTRAHGGSASLFEEPRQSGVFLPRITICRTGNGGVCLPDPDRFEASILECCVY